MSTGLLAAIMLFAGFLGGFVVGVIVIVSVASRREDSLYSLDGEAPDAACRGARRLTAAGVRGSGFRPASYLPESGADPQREGPGQ